MRYELGTMRVAAISDSLQRLTNIARIAGSTLVMTVRAAFDTQGEGRVASVIDARSVRLEDGREVRLAGITSSAKPLSGKPSTGSTALAGLACRA